MGGVKGEEGDKVYHPPAYHWKLFIISQEHFSPEFAWLASPFLRLSFAYVAEFDLDFFLFYFLLLPGKSKQKTGFGSLFLFHKPSQFD